MYRIAAMLGFRTLRIGNSLWRRRVGKTLLIERFFNDKYDFKFVGARNLSTRTQLANFARTFKKYGARDVKTLSNCSDAFYALENYLEPFRETGRKSCSSMRCHGLTVSDLILSVPLSISGTVGL